MQTTINIILLSMHREPGLTADKAPATNATQSLYMKELQEFVQRSWHLHIVPFSDRDTIAVCGRALAEHCIELFIHNVIVIRPISPAGRRKLHADAQHLETALRPIVADISSFGRSYRYACGCVVEPEPAHTQSSLTFATGSCEPSPV